MPGFHIRSQTFKIFKHYHYGKKEAACTFLVQAFYQEYQVDLTLIATIANSKGYMHPFHVPNAKKS